MDNRDLAVHASGPLACFTRPEYAAERVSYPVITPPAAQGLLSAIFWKPEFRWRLTQVWVLQDIEWLSITRNEVDNRASLRSGSIRVDEHRVQRHSLCLRDVSYVLFADIDLHHHATDPPAKYRDQFRRRVQRGACWSRPYLGLQEFHADFRAFDPERDRPNADVTLPIGPMPLDLGFSTSEGQERIDPVWFQATVIEGVLNIPTVGEVTSAS